MKKEYHHHDMCYIISIVMDIPIIIAILAPPPRPRNVEHFHDWMLRIFWFFTL